MTLRPYQQEAVDAAIAELKASIAPCLIDAATGAGKSHIIATIAEWLHNVSGGKRVLCLAPRAELVKQNHAKYLATGNRASIFSAGAGSKSTTQPVIFGTPGTVSRSMSRFVRGFAAVVLDEAHAITPTVKVIIDAMREHNPTLRVIGLTATPYRLGSGYIFRIWPDGRINGDDVARDPYFSKCVYRVEAPTLIDQGFLTRPVIGALNTGGYETDGLVLRKSGTFDPATVDKAFVGHGRKTAAILADVVTQAQNRHGVVLFASTLRHAAEIMASLPPELSACITGETTDKEREKILRKFDRQQVKYLVNVGVLTTGWDAPHVDLIAILRRTESVGLLQQIIGRGLRLFDGKADCLILDYAENLDTHCPDGDLFRPVIKAGKIGGGGEPIEAHCPDCHHVNQFSLNPDYADYKRDAHGYCLDVFGERIVSEYGPISAHYGRRCMGELRSGPRGEYERCGYRWTGKDCPECGEKNDIAARYCYVCKAEIVDPNAKLIADFKAMKRDPSQAQTDMVLSMTTKEGTSARGNATLRVDWVTLHRNFSTWFQPESTFRNQMREYGAFMQATDGGETPPGTVSYVKDVQSGFYRVLAYNQPADEEPHKPALAFAWAGASGGGRDEKDKAA